MRDDELQTLVDEFLYLVEVGSGSTAADESELAHLLDRLALALREGVDPGEPEEAPEIPARDRDVLEKVAGSRFPGYGDYNRATPTVGRLRDARVEAGNAHRDVATIADHLHATAWLWRRADWEVGLWYLHASHRESWGPAMRALQLYLQVRESAARAEAGEDDVSPKGPGD